MTQHEQAQGPQEVTVNPRAFDLMQRGAEQAFGKPVGELDFDEASRLVGGIVMATTQGGSGKVSHEGRVVVDSEADGKEALAGYGRQMAREMAPRIDDERELVINVTRNKTLWDTIRRREPKVEHTFRFRNEPPQYV